MRWLAVLAVVTTLRGPTYADNAHDTHDRGRLFVGAGVGFHEGVHLDAGIGVHRYLDLDVRGFNLLMIGGYYASATVHIPTTGPNYDLLVSAGLGRFSDDGFADDGTTHHAARRYAIGLASTSRPFSWRIELGVLRLDDSTDSPVSITLTWLNAVL